MPAIAISPDVYWIGVNDRTTDLFEGLWPISQSGVSYNSYFIDDEKKAIIDLTKAFKGDEYIAQMDLLTDISKVDYIVVNHMEPDHSGLVRTIRRIAPKAVFLGSAKTKEMLKNFFSIDKNVEVVGDGDTLSLGRKTLKFFHTPFLHWPETIMTYDSSEHILFSCDAFGGYGALRGAIFDDECCDFDFYQNEALRYYVNIVANFSSRVLAAIEKLKDLPVDIIAPSHGLIWRRKPALIVDLYKQWAECASGPVDQGVTLIYGSMYGNTEVVMNAVAHGISQSGIALEIFDAARTHASYILPSLWTKRGVMIGAPTYEVSLFPPVAEVLHMAAHKHIKNKTAAYFGSYGWSGGALRGLKKIVEPLRWEMTDTFEFQGSPTVEDIAKAEAFGRKFADSLKPGAR
jgi:anaerobic nitric oxide reductase flavorubredoxin